MKGLFDVVLMVGGSLLTRSLTKDELVITGGRRRSFDTSDCIGLDHRSRRFDEDRLSHTALSPLSISSDDSLSLLLPTGISGFSSSILSSRVGGLSLLLMGLDLKFWVRWV